MASPQTPTLKVSLQPVTSDNRDAVLALKLAEHQQKFIATNARTLDQAASAPEAWLRAIYAGESLVGLLLLHDEHLRTPPREQGYYYLWRVMIDVAHQRKGYGRQTVDLVLDYVSTRPHAKRLLSSYIPGEGGPEQFYKDYGFTPTGNMIEEDVEIEIKIPITNTSSNSS